MIRIRPNGCDSLIKLGEEFVSWTRRSFGFGFVRHIQDVGGEEKEWDIEEEEIDMPVDQDLEDNDVLTPICITQKSSRGTNWANIEVPAALRNTLKFGIKALAWDDWTGRIFAATLNDCMIHVIDLAQGPKENSRGQRIPVPLAGG